MNKQNHCNPGKPATTKNFVINKEQIRLFWEFINHRDKNHKFQVFKKDGSATEFIDVSTVDELIKQCEKHNLEGISCLSVNPTKTKTMKTDGIIEIDNILIDIDVRTQRKKYGVSTEEYKKVAEETAWKIIKELEEKINLRVSLIVDSGNGYHLYIPINIDLSSFFTSGDEGENKKLWDNSGIKSRLAHFETLLKDFSNENVEIDCISKDIARRVKIPGTWNVKEGISEENYRISKIVKSYEDTLEDLIIQSNTRVFNSFCLEEKEKIINANYTIPDKKTDIRPCFKALMRRKTQIDGGTGHNLKYALLNELVACGCSDTEIHDAFKLQKNYKEKEVQNRINELREKGKVTPFKCDTLKERFKELRFSLDNLCNKCPLELKRKLRQIKIPIDDYTSATLKILGKNAFEITNGNEVLLPPTDCKKTIWFSSIFYRRLIRNSLIHCYDLKAKNAEQITNNLCASAQKRIKELTKDGVFRGQLNDELKEILGTIKKVTCTRSEDGNIYNIHMDGESIRLTDRQLYNDSREFCIQYLNRFFKKIIISNEQWDEVVLSYLLSDDILVKEENKIDTKNDIVVEKFLRYIGNKRVYDWVDTKKRMGHKNSLFYRLDKEQVLLSSEFVNAFFEHLKINVTDRITNTDFANHLREKGYLVEGRSSERIGGENYGCFWHFNPDKINILRNDITKTDKNKGGEDSGQGKLSV